MPCRADSCRHDYAHFLYMRSLVQTYLAVRKLSVDPVTSDANPQTTPNRLGNPEVAHHLCSFYQHPVVQTCSYGFIRAVSHGDSSTCISLYLGNRNKVLLCSLPSLRSFMRFCCDGRAVFFGSIVNMIH